MTKQSFITILLTVLMSMVGVNVNAQDSQTKRTIHVATAGTLPDLISKEDKYMIEELTLTGELNGTDIKCIWDMSGTGWSYFKYEDKYYYEVSSEGKLKVLDITDTKIVEGGDWYFTWDYDESGRAFYSHNNTISQHMFSGCRKLTSIKLPNSVISIYENTFPGGLTSITIPNSVTYIAGNALYRTAWFNNQPEGLVYTGKVAYRYKGEMPVNTTILLEEGLLGIAESAFCDCTGLASVTIPSSVTTIGWRAFSGCNGLTSIVSRIAIPFPINENVFSSEVYSTATLTVPYGTKSLYEATDGWKNFQNIVEADDPTSQIDYSKQPFTIVPVDKDLVVWFLGEWTGHCTESIKVYWSYDGGETWESGIGDYWDVTVNLGQKISFKISDHSGECSSAWGVNNKDREDKALGRFYVEGTLGGLKPCNGYKGFFKGKTTLISAENLYIPKGTNCEEMFSGCTSLTKAPVLSDKVLGKNQYKNMFKGCTSLNNIKCLATDISAEGCIEGWVDGVSPTGTFVKRASTVWPSGASGIPSGWTVEASAPIRRTINVETAGTLHQLIPEDEKYQIEELTLSGELNGSDIGLIREMAGAGCRMEMIGTSGWEWVDCETDGILRILDISKAKIVSGGNYYMLGKHDPVGEKFTECFLIAEDNCISQYMFYKCKSLTSIAIPNSVTSIIFSDCSSLTSVIIGNGVTFIRNSFSKCNNLKEMILSQTAYDNGIPESVTKFTTYSKNPMRVEVVSKGVVSATMKIYPIDDENNCYTVTTSGQTAGQYIRWKLDDENYGIISEKTEGTLTLETQQAQPMSTTKARLSAIVNEADDDQHFGFEWLRHNAPDDMQPYKVSAPLYDGRIVGSLSGLNPDVYYKYRPYYQSDSGDMTYGKWITFNTGDANVFFEPEVHTKEATAVKNGGALLSGVWVEGTDDIQEKGFEYWPKSSGARAVSYTIGTNVSTVIVSGNNTSATLKGLKSGVEYGYRSYVKTASKTYYGEEMTFKTPLVGDANNDGKVDASDIVAVVNAKAGKPSASFNMTNADMDGNGTLTEADITAIANIIMKSTR